MAKMVENLARVGRKFELDQIQANSSQVGDQMIPISSQVESLDGVGLSWEYRSEGGCPGRGTLSIAVPSFPSHDSKCKGSHVRRIEQQITCH